MQKVFRFIKKKRNLRRLSVVWLFLLTMELFCPAFCDEPTFAAELNIPQSQISVSIEVKDKASETSLSACEHQNSGNHDETVCNDECLCHATAIPSINGINLKHSVISVESIAFRYGKPIFNSLPPPFQPPKNS